MVYRVTDGYTTKGSVAIHKLTTEGGGKEGRRLKPSLKTRVSAPCSTTNSSSTFSSSSSSSTILSPVSSSSSLNSTLLKNVRFAPQLTTIKRFDSNSEPMSISNENSPVLSPIRNSKNFMKFQKSLAHNNNFRFNQLQHPQNNSEEEEEESDDDDDDDIFTLERHRKKSCPASNILNLHIEHTNLIPCEDSNEHSVSRYLQGQNIKLHEIKQQANNEIVGLIYVNNLNFEKFLEVKFTFNNWKDIHHIQATYNNRSISSRIDEFIFVINLNSFKFFLDSKKLLTNTLHLELCCRYDVNNETFYDNNNYQNYQIELSLDLQDYSRRIAHASPTPIITKSPEFTVESVRKFSENTDYFNTSPLKHYYHHKAPPSPSSSLSSSSSPDTLKAYIEDPSVPAGNGFASTDNHPKYLDIYDSTDSLSLDYTIPPSSSSFAESGVDPVIDHSSIHSANQYLSSATEFNTSRPPSTTHSHASFLNGGFQSLDNIPRFNPDIIARNTAISDGISFGSDRQNVTTENTPTPTATRDNNSIFHHHNNNNSADTLTNDDDHTIFNDNNNNNNQSILRDMDYQTLLSSYCFFRPSLDSFSPTPLSNDNNYHILNDDDHNDQRHYSPDINSSARTILDTERPLSSYTVTNSSTPMLSD